MNTLAESAQHVGDLLIHRQWWAGPEIGPAVRSLLPYGPGENRATGYLYSAGEQHWPAELATVGPGLLDGLERLTGVRYTVAAGQAYRDGAGCDWHTDGPFDAQAVLSLGVSRTFGVRPIGGDPLWTVVHGGDLVVMPSGFQANWQHCVPAEDVPGERHSLVFRTVVR